MPLVEIERIGDAAPLAWPELAPASPPLEGIRVLDLTRILAGPVAGRTLAAYGADVMLVNSPTLPNIEAIADTSRGKRSALADLRDPSDRVAFGAALASAQVLLQGYRPGGIAALGFGPDAVARLRPGIVYVSLSAYGRAVRGRRGAASTRWCRPPPASTTPKARPPARRNRRRCRCRCSTWRPAFLLAFGAEAALLRQRREGGSWHVQVSLARTALWLRSLGRVADGFAAAKPDFASRMEASDSGFGRLVAVRHAARFSATPAAYRRPSVRPGTDRLEWN
jgi:crotonobetainyl-CoA:carnitine CoA-transferase CaiB-like acyl-CoA transferase